LSIAASAEVKMSLNFNCSYMVRISLTFILGFSVKYFFILKQQLTTKEISIFSNGSHLEWRTGLSDTILKGTIPARFGLIWFSGFRGEDDRLCKLEKKGG
jgi:hypothetical protein